MSLHKKISINPDPDSVIAGPTYFDQALNVLVDECKISIDKNTDNKEKHDTQNDSLRNIKPVDSISVSDQKAFKLSTAERLEKAKSWLNSLKNNASWLSTEELMLLATLNAKNITIKIGKEKESESFSVSSENNFSSETDSDRIIIRYKDGHYERVENGQAQKTVGDGYCGWHALFGDKNSEGKFELQGGKEYRDLYIKVGINTIDNDNIKNLYKNHILSDFMLDEVIKVRN